MGRTYQKSDRRMFLKHARAIKNMGYRVIVKKPDKYYLNNYGYIIDADGKFCNFHLSEWAFGCINIDSCHKPCEHSGTGFRIAKDLQIHHVTSPIIETAIHISTKYGKEVRKWESYSEFESKRIIGKSQFRELK